MRSVAIGFALLAVAAFVGVSVLAQIAGEPGFGLGEMFIDSPPLGKLADLLLALCTVGAVVIGLIRGADGTRPAAAMLPFVGWVALGVGFLVALHGVLFTAIAAGRVHVTNFRVVAPSLTEALITLGTSLLCAALCFALAPSRRSSPRPTG